MDRLVIKYLSVYCPLVGAGAGIIGAPAVGAPAGPLGRMSMDWAVKLPSELDVPITVTFSPALRALTGTTVGCETSVEVA